jgi:hypothetical protein
LNIINIKRQDMVLDLVLARMRKDG